MAQVDVHKETELVDKFLEMEQELINTAQEMMNKTTFLAYLAFVENGAIRLLDVLGTKCCHNCAKTVVAARRFAEDNGEVVVKRNET